jgi:hypothetical protein
MQIIVGAMAFSSATFLLVFTVIRFQSEHPPAADDMSILVYVGLALSVANGTMGLIMPRFLERSLRRRLGSPSSKPETEASLDAWYEGYAKQMIIRAALFEGVCLYWIIIYFIQGWPISLVAALLFLVAIVLQFPTRDGVERWISRQRDEAAQERIM